VLTRSILGPPSRLIRRHRRSVGLRAQDRFARAAREVAGLAGSGAGRHRWRRADAPDSKRRSPIDFKKAAPEEPGRTREPALSSHLQKIFHASPACLDRPQLLAAARVTMILMHRIYWRGKNLGIFLFEGLISGIFSICNSIFYRYLRDGPRVKIRNSLRLRHLSEQKLDAVLYNRETCFSRAPAMLTNCLCS
jgi:hypothetical protein